MTRLRWLFRSPGQAATIAEPSPELVRLEDATARLASDIAGAHANLNERLDRLLGETGRLGREQFRATTLLEGQGTTLEELTEAWHEHLERREGEVAEFSRALSELEGRVRLGLVKDLLPVADALDASVRAARELLPALRPPPPRRPSLAARLRGQGGESAVADDRGPALESWLDGLLLIERRLLALLEREGVRPISARGQAFDPHRHLAVAVTRANGVADGTVVGEELRGYTLGERVLRHAEVVVARGGSGDTSVADNGAR